MGQGRPGPDRCRARPRGRSSSTNLELVFDRDAKVDDGRYANNGWLQELSNPITKLAWGNAALLSPKTARELGIADGDVIRLELDGRSLEIPAMLLPGQADYSVGVALGYGRTACGRIGQDVGYNAYALRTSKAPDVATGLKVSQTGRRATLATHPGTLHDGGPRPDPRAHARRSRSCSPRTASHHEEELPDIQTPPVVHGEHQWGMAIDLNTCTGCSACVLACQSENNIPIVGKDEIPRGREMHWIRIDRYFAGDPDEPEMVHQPVACVHCEKAPCEVVCPVNATVHGEEGSTSWSTAGASAPATARTTALTRCAGSTTSTTTSGRSTSSGTAPSPSGGWPRP